MSDNFSRITVEDMKSYGGGKVKKDTVDVKKIMDKKKELSKEAIAKFVIIYNNCIAKIKDGLKYNKIDLIFTVPSIYVEIPKYDSYECLLYIQKNLIKEGFDAVIYSKNKIYVNWEKKL
jgi:hypothetical protein